MESIFAIDYGMHSRSVDTNRTSKKNKQSRHKKLLLIEICNNCQYLDKKLIQVIKLFYSAIEQFTHFQCILNIKTHEIIYSYLYKDNL